MAEVSIIVPVYQVEKYIKQCVDSIISQTFTDFELILVDDGSKDNSGKICDEYAQKDGRIKVIHQKNCGLSQARNTGMEKASGKYFMFVDSDDYIAPNMAECLYKNITEGNYDIVACNFRHFFEDDEKKDFSTENKAEVLSGNEIFYYKKNERNYGFWTIACNKIYKAETFKNVRFRAEKYHEDEFWANDIYRMDIKAASVSDCLYYYRQRHDSITGNKNIQKYLDIIEALEERIYVYLNQEKYCFEAYKVLIYSLEYLYEGKKIIQNDGQKAKIRYYEQQTKNIIKVLRETNLSKIHKISLLIIGINPCFAFGIAIKFRKLLERFL